jgi:hypothetical protein
MSARDANVESQHRNANVGTAALGCPAKQSEAQHHPTAAAPDQIKEV